MTIDRIINPAINAPIVSMPCGVNLLGSIFPPPIFADPLGLEPRTYPLTADCSAN